MYEFSRFDATEVTERAKQVGIALHRTVLKRTVVCFTTPYEGTTRACDLKRHVEKCFTRHLYDGMKTSSRLCMLGSLLSTDTPGDLSWCPRMPPKSRLRRRLGNMGAELPPVVCDSVLVVLPTTSLPSLPVCPVSAISLPTPLSCPGNTPNMFTAGPLKTPCERGSSLLPTCPSSLPVAFKPDPAGTGAAGGVGPLW